MGLEGFKREGFGGFRNGCLGFIYSFSVADNLLQDFLKVSCIHIAFLQAL